MIKKLVRKKKVLKKSVKSKVNKTKKKKAPAVASLKAIRPLAKKPLAGKSPRIPEIFSAFEPGPLFQTRLRPVNGRLAAYYAMGAVALGAGLISLGYQIFRTKVVEYPKEITTKIESPSMTQDQLTAALPVERGYKKKIRNSVGSSEVLAAEFSQAHGMSLSERIQFWSAYLEHNLLGRSKVASFAAGFQVDDTAPLVADQYNCTTYVETVAALARSETPDQFVKNLISIRYLGGHPGFIQRNHFPEADWIPNNEKADILTDITNQISQKAGVAAKVETKVIDRGKWLAVQMQRHSNYRNLASIEGTDWAKPVEAHVSYIEIFNIKKILNEIPNGTVLNLVHRNDERHPVLITHQGFVVREGERVLLRHASTGGLIRTTELYPYLKTLLSQQKKSADWPLIGVNLNQINVSTSDSSFLRQSM